MVCVCLDMYELVCTDSLRGLVAPEPGLEAAGDFLECVRRTVLCVPVGDVLCVYMFHMGRVGGEECSVGGHTRSIPYVWERESPVGGNDQ